MSSRRPQQSLEPFSLQAGSHTLTARFIAGSGWQVEIVGFIWSSHLSRAGAERCMDLLAKSTTTARAAGGELRTRLPCPKCGRVVGADRNRVIGWHYPREPEPGHDMAVCLGWGETAPERSP